MRNNIPIFVFLQALGLSRKKIIYSIKHIKTLKNYTKTNINKSTEKALIKLNEITIEQESNIVRLKDVRISNMRLSFKILKRIIIHI
jgi:hypothetical protein